MEFQDCPVIDYTKDFTDTVDPDIEFLFVHGKGKHVLILSKLGASRKRFDGKKAAYELVHRELSQRCQDDKDEAYVCVVESEVTFWQRKEFDLKALKSGSKTLFDCFNLF